MVRLSIAGPLKNFTNIEAVFDRLEELDFFADESHKLERLEQLTEEYPSVHASNEFWFGNRVLELKIFRRMFGVYELCNFRGIIDPRLDSLFELAEVQKIGA